MTTASTSQAKEKAGDWVERLARAGYAAKGVLYFIIGILAVRAAFSSGGQTGGSKDALRALANEGTFAMILLWAIGIGLVGYALWNAFRAIMDPEHEGNDGKGIAKRIFFGISAVIHASLAVYVFTTLLSSGGGGDSGGDGTQGIVGKVMAWGMIGRLLVAAVGAGIGGFGVQQLIKAWKVDLSDHLSLGGMSEKTRKLTIYTGRAGLAARGIVFVMVGLFFITAAWQYDSSEAGGTGAALSVLGRYPWILGLVAIGLACYGVYMLIKAKYRRIDPT